MMFPVNRPASELTATELINLYDQAQNEFFLRTARNEPPPSDTLKELRAEIERRMDPCPVCKARRTYSFSQQAQEIGQGSIAQALAQSQLDPTRGGNR